MSPAEMMPPRPDRFQGTRPCCLDVRHLDVRWSSCDTCSAGPMRTPGPPARLDQAFGGRERLTLGTYDPSFAAAWTAVGGELAGWQRGSGLWDLAGFGGLLAGAGAAAAVQAWELRVRTPAGARACGCGPSCSGGSWPALRGPPCRGGGQTGVSARVHRLGGRGGRGRRRRRWRGGGSW